MRSIEFVSYDGAYPNLCSGTLVIKIDGEEKSFKRVLSSGGSIKFDKNWNCQTKQGAWKLRSIEGFSDEEILLIEKLVNENVSHGCCGGCA